MKEITLQVYSLSELNEKAREKALSHFIDIEYPFHSDNVKSVEAFCNAFPCEVRGFEYGYGYFVNKQFTDDENIANLSGARLLAYLHNNYFNILHKAKKYAKNGKKRKSNIFFEETDCPFTGYYMDHALLNNIREFIKKPTNETFKDLLYDSLDNWIKACNTDYEYYYSEEYIADFIELNEYEFLESGELFNV